MARPNGERIQKPVARAARARKDEKPQELRVRIVVADHHAIDRGGLVGLLEDERDFEVVGEAATVDEVILQYRSLEPHLVVMSMNLPGQDDDPAIPRIRAAIPDARILAMSDRGTHNCLVLNPPTRKNMADALHTHCEFGTDCLQVAVTQGAMGTLRRHADPEDLFRAIRSVAAGESWYDSTTTSGLLSIQNPLKKPKLSDREKQVASLIAEGLSNKEISAALDISEPTVKKHVGHVLEKLGLQDRLQAGLYIARNPLIIRA
jgi:DNA-binding NarL/FixJ family response regulator